MMGNWGRRERGFGNHSSRGVWRQRSSANRPPPHDGYKPVPSWERKFCESVGRVSWRRLLDVKEFMYLYKDILYWNDEAGKEAFKNAKNRYWAEINGLPCNTALPDPDIYIDKVDWDVKIDPELILDLERAPEVCSETEHDPVVIGKPPLLEYTYYACGIGWDNIVYEADGAIRWDRYDDRIKAVDESNIKAVDESKGQVNWNDNFEVPDLATEGNNWINDNLVLDRPKEWDNWNDDNNVVDGSKGWDNWNNYDNVAGGWSEPWQGDGYNEQKRENRWERERSTGQGRGRWSYGKKARGGRNGNSSGVNRGGYGWNGGCKGGGRGRRVEAGGCGQQRWAEKRGYCGRW